MSKKYEIIYADPPWSFKNKNTGGSMTSGADAQYSTMNIDDICNLPIESLAADNCVLFMWWVASQPKEAIKVVESWGFTLKTMSGFDWVKLTKNEKLHFGMGFWTRMGSESCLIAVKGKPKRLNAGIRSVELVDVDESIIDMLFPETCLAKVGKHSEKPDIFRTRIVELMGDIPRIELFAREENEGWDVFGNEVNNSIDLK
jgi:N6-adenosine-specific RNA methylase IME4